MKKLLLLTAHGLKFTEFKKTITKITEEVTPDSPTCSEVRSTMQWDLQEIERMSL